ncbi:hypothetical protein [Sphingomonas sp. SUN039]|uniref:hypothetical protein n=1 Tax=Sphingomonas sp. SUN039 TaxID=2937787 RepID=UPI002164D072|nr:hypothetical protein [Sphingomonas sp. SUN039]UVO54892.1 hypothetical protein M0209_12440 [Sphingomonas sp. SUN039]
MVSQILMLLALATTTPVEGAGGARAEARVSATIQRGVTLRAETVTSEIRLLPAAARASRPCISADKPEPECRLIVYDLP